MLQSSARFALCDGCSDAIGVVRVATTLPDGSLIETTPVRFESGELPDAYTIVGAAIIVAAGLYIFWRERAAARKAEPIPVEIS